MAKEYFDIRRFKGMITEGSAEELNREYARNSENCEIDGKFGALIRRKGTINYHKFGDIVASPIQGEIETLYATKQFGLLATAKYLYPYADIFSEDNDWAIVERDANDWADAPATRLPGVEHKWRLLLHKGYIFAASGVMPLAYWQGKDFKLQLVGGHPVAGSEEWDARYTVPWAKYIWEHQGILFLANGSGKPDTLYYASKVDLEGNFVYPNMLAAWGGTNIHTLGNGLDITGGISYRNKIIVFQKKHIWIGSGYYPNYFWQELKINSGEEVGCIGQDCVAIKDELLYGMDENCIWVYNGNEIKDITEDTIKTKYQDRILFPIRKTDSLRLYLQEDWGTNPDSYSHSYDTHAIPGVLQLCNPANMYYDGAGGYMPFLDYASAWDGNPITYAKSDSSSGDTTRMELIFKDIYNEEYTCKLKDIMIDWDTSDGAISTVELGYYVGDVWTDRALSKTSGREVKQYTFRADGAIVENVARIRITITYTSASGYPYIYNIWFPGDETAPYMLPSQLYTCKNVKSWGHLESDLKLTTNIGAKSTDLNYADSGIKIELKDAVEGIWHEVERGERIPLPDTGDRSIAWRITIWDANEADQASARSYPHYPKLFSLKLPWLTSGEWYNQPFCQEWNNKLFFVFPHKGDSKYWIELDKNNWYLHKARNMVSSMCAYDNILYGGRTTNTLDSHGEILKLDTGLSDADFDGSSDISTIWETKRFKLSDPRLQFELQRLDITLKNNESSDKDFTISYCVDDKSPIPTKTITALANTEKEYSANIGAGLNGHNVYFKLIGSFDFEVKEFIAQVEPKSIL